MREHYLITRLKKLRPVFNAIFHRTATTKHALPIVSASIANVIKEAQIAQIALGHMEEGHFDSQQLSDEFAHITTFAINLPTTLEGDGGFWGYALSLVGDDTFKEGVKYCSRERIERFIEVLNDVLVIKLEIEQTKEELAKR